MDRKEKAREYARRYYEENKDRIKEANKRHYHQKPKKPAERPVGRPKGTKFPEGYKRQPEVYKSPPDANDIRLETPKDVMEFAGLN